MPNTIGIIHIMNLILTELEHKKYRGLLPVANTLRNKQTPYEKKLWRKIKNRKLLNILFYRQKILLNYYIIDFYAPQIKLAIEVDGLQHTFTELAEKDKLRDGKLKSLNITVKRYSNLMISKHIDYVMTDLYNCICDLLII